MPISNVSDAKEEALAQRMRKMNICEADLQEKFVRASGPGGQKVNKTSSCVQLKHLPTGLLVRCQRERSQALNRFIARCRLLDRIEKARNGFVAEEKAKAAKIRRQKRRRSRRAKEKMLAGKRRLSEKKQRRAPVEEDL
jgi:protein subunit release factor B